MPAPIVCDMSRIVDPDGPVLDALARLALTARRMGTSIELRNTCPRLADLIEIAGLGDVVAIVNSGVDVDGQVEEREQRRVDKEVLGGDGTV